MMRNYICYITKVSYCYNQSILLLQKLKKQLFEAAKGGDVTFVTDTLNQHPDYINIRDKSWVS